MTFRSLGLVELAGLGIRCLQHLGVLVVDHRLGDVDLAVEQQGHVERLDHLGVVLVLHEVRTSRPAAVTSYSLPKSQTPMLLARELRRAR